MSPHVYIVGQTASGKTGLSIDLCDELGYAILNTDSLLFYKGLDIGTAKPSTEELSRVKHHLIDVCDPGEEYTAATYLENAKAVLKTEGKKFLCVGGSGFYINALDVGLLPLPKTDPEIRELVLTIENPVEELEKVDPEIFNKISKNDLYRVGRALEVFKQTGKPLSQWQKEYTPKPFAKKMAFDLDRGFLRERITERARIMVKEGIVDEAKTLIDQGFGDWKPLHSVGYAQALKYLSGELKTEDDMVEEMVHKTMQLSKRQKTWFRKDKSVTWFDFSEKKKAKEFIKNCLEEDLWKV